MSALFERIDTVFLLVRDFDKAIQWYTETFGFTVRWRHDEGGFAALNVGETPLTLVRLEEGMEIRSTQQALFNFYVKDPEEAHRVLVAAGADVDPIQDPGNVKFFDFRDPDGNLLSVCSW
jgi:catechol 2,3-dioxygenase-like lactoylglutathione lyase family enzyme